MDSHNQHREVSGEPGLGWLMTHKELLTGSIGVLGSHRQSAHLDEANVVLGGMAVWPNGQAVWGTSKSFLEFWPICLGSPLITVWLFWAFVQCFKWPIPWAFADGPSVSRIHASPVVRGQKPWASRCSNFSLDFSS